ncbi:hypothetical protein [Aquimarina sp. AU474]|uniref:hypothetical protein n=1 Tax=Aquimarina sp. AU474 TaxID=2108529 RepID=UPI000D69DABD|nr:hypothetical protein [Aquimarina sp. AU474]
MKKLFLIPLALITLCCSNDDDGGGTTTGVINPGNDPNFTIVTHSDAGFSAFNRKVVVFGIDIYAVAGVEDAKLLHAANVMAQYLDNDEDGVVDDQLVLDKMIENKAFVVMWASQNDLSGDIPEGRIGQDLGNGETNPSFVSNGRTGQFDASLEEILHIINNAGHSYAYPSVFGQNVGSDLANAMDIARGGQFMNIPNPYPAGAWYTYDDATCEYANCQTIEYLYWALTSLLGAQENRLNEISQEWDLNTASLVQNTDTAIYALLTNSVYNMPTVLPDGTYMQ